MNKTEPEKYHIEIPEGYKWCNECDALTPHIKEMNPEFSWQKSYQYCVICENQIDIDQQEICPNCGWSYEKYYNNQSHINIQVHNIGCHYDYKYEYDSEEDENEDGIPYAYYQYGSYAEKIWREFKRENLQFKKIKEVKCSCPEYTIITDPYCYSYNERSVFSMDCMNAIEWNLKIRCPICGGRFEISDGNC